MKIFKEILSDNNVDRIICIYPGRFQPFSPHHRTLYHHLCMKFGIDNVIVAVSDNEVGTDRNPFDVDLRMQICRMNGVKNVFAVSSPYRPIEITKNFNPLTTAMVIALGSKDYDDRMCDSDVYGHRYYVKYNDYLVPLSKKGFLYILPEISVNGEVTSATHIRDYLRSSKGNFEILGWNEPELYRRMAKKLNIFPNKKFRKRILHVWEHDITFRQLFDLIEGLLQGKIYNVTEKIDGQHLLFTVKDGRVAYAKTAQGISNPQPSEEFLRNINIDAFNVFSNVCAEIENVVRQIDCEPFFRNGDVFLSIEIVDPSLTNVIAYDRNFYLILHGFLPKLDYILDQFYQCTHSYFSAYKLLTPRTIILNGIYNSAKIGNEFVSQISGLMKSESLQLTDSIQRLSDYGKTILEMKLSKIGNLIIDEIDVHLCKSKFSCVEKIRKEIENVQMQVNKDENKKKRFSELMRKLESVGGLESINAIEGIVFEYCNREMKMTGSFRYVNQIIAMNKYSR